MLPSRLYINLFAPYEDGRKCRSRSSVLCLNQPERRQHRDNKKKADMVHKHFMERLTAQQVHTIEYGIGT